MNESDLRSILKCVRCGTCRSVCPVFDVIGWESASSRGRMLVAHGISQGMEVDESVFDSINTCTTCGLCEQMCPSGASPVKVVENVRHKLVLQGKMTDAQKVLRFEALDKGNPLGETKDRMSWLGDSKKDVKEKADYVFFAGCLASYRYPELTKRTFDILKKFEVTVLQEEVCCGSPLLRTGSDSSELMSKNLEQIKKIGAHTIITGCAGCLTTLKNDYPGDVKVVHVAEFLADRLEELDLKKLDLKVTYHDPCHLGRCNGIFDAPRKIIESICDLEEMKSNREKSKCCGAGGGVLKGYPELSLEISKNRVEEIPKDVDYLVTACPLCRTNLKRGGPRVDVLDIIDLLEMAMG
ncbi:heterodisulfide reductase-related iron-sulfur binding cluster [Methanolobus sp.]|jgi:fumarate reductase (CoM/CoB) subunit B|uniref:(Fe-S)-binding protein n=1 Tax=Methanolobus sp. TaxID=1874737 RepID=UPI0025E7E210|nr:heterodisulfide reductase-related iron-sulfur binding cluster [Methanolobus sp.]